MRASVYRRSVTKPVVFCDGCGATQVHEVALNLFALRMGADPALCGMSPLTDPGRRRRLHQAPRFPLDRPVHGFSTFASDWRFLSASESRSNCKFTVDRPLCWDCGVVTLISFNRGRI